jgi:Sugar (and other) transporter
LLEPRWTFWLYGVMAIAAWIFSYNLVPETKGRTLEEIEEHWRVLGHARTDLQGSEQIWRGRQLVRWSLLLPWDYFRFARHTPAGTHKKGSGTLMLSQHVHDRIEEEHITHQGDGQCT